MLLLLLLFVFGTFALGIVLDSHLHAQREVSHRHEAQGTRHNKGSPGKESSLGPCLTRAGSGCERAAKRSEWKGGGGRSAIRILLTLRLVRVPVFGDASLHEKLAACFGPKQLCAMQFLPVVLEIHFAAAASVTQGGDCCGSCLGCCHKRKLLLSARRLLATQHLVPLSQYHISVPLFDILFSLVLSVCLTASKLYLVMQKGQRRQRLPRLQLQLLYR